MRAEQESLDISTSPELIRLAEEVRQMGKPRVLRRDSEELAVVVPLSAPRKPRLKKRRLTAADIEAFRSAAGSWADVDVDKFLEDIYADREQGGSPRRTAMTYLAASSPA